MRTSLMLLTLLSCGAVTAGEGDNLDLSLPDLQEPEYQFMGNKAIAEKSAIASNGRHEKATLETNGALISVGGLDWSVVNIDEQLYLQFERQF